MGDRSLPEPAEFVLWTAAGLLAMVLGVGTAFVFWGALRAAEGTLADTGIACLSAGVAVVGLAVARPLHRAFFVLFAVTLLVAFLLGGPEFARLIR